MAVATSHRLSADYISVTYGELFQIPDNSQFCGNPIQLGIIYLLFNWPVSSNRNAPNAEARFRRAGHDFALTFAWLATNECKRGNTMVTATNTSALNADMSFISGAEERTHKSLQFLF
jgi:hypothetical protein